MNPLIRRAGTVMLGLGLDPRKTWSGLRALPQFVLNLRQFNANWTAQARAGYQLRLVPTLSDRYAESGVARGHYFHQDLWAARLVHRASPDRHIDVGSRIDGFIAHLLSFRAVDVVDIRRLKSHITGLRFFQANLMAEDIPVDLRAKSVSCLHALEHFGLGRYGDPIDPDGWLKGLRNLAAMTEPGGQLLLSVPVGQPCIEFDAQRIFDPRHVIEAAQALGLGLRTFSAVDDAGDFHQDVTPDWAAQLSFGCGCFHFDRPGDAA